MKKFLLSLFMVGATMGAMAQGITSYFVPDAVERVNHNAAFAPERGYVSIPFVGSTILGVGGNISVSSLLHTDPDGRLVTLLDGSVSAADALGKLNKNSNFMGVDSRLDLFNFGAYCSDHESFWSFNLSIRNNVNFNIPYEFFEFVKLGEQNNISGIGVHADSYLDLGFGYSKPINDKLIVGGRVKFLVGLVSADLDVTKFDVAMGLDEWRVDAAGDVNIYGNGLTAGDGEPGSDFDLGDLNFDLAEIGPAGFGVALDLGAEYELVDNLKFSLAANDVGFLTWSQKSNTSATMAATQNFTGVDVTTGGNSVPNFSLDDIKFLNGKSASATRFLQANINAGAEYKLFNDLIGVGVVYTMDIWSTKTSHSLVAAASVRPLSWFTLAASYGFTNTSDALGLALNISPCWFNLYVATDILIAKKSAQYIPIEQSLANVSLGLAIPIGKRSLRSPYTRLTK